MLVSALRLRPHTALRYVSARTICNAPLLGRPSQLVLCARHTALDKTRRVHSSASRLAPSSTQEHAHEPAAQDTTLVYTGPMSTTLRRLKLFSLSSLGLSCALTPFLFIVESSLPLTARCVLAGTALFSSGVSTGLVAWAAGPYVTAIRHVPLGGKGEEGEGGYVSELTTLSIRLREYTTRVYDPAFLVDARRPFAKWELARSVVVPDAAGVGEGSEETVAETWCRGRVVGRWIVRWGPGGSGLCRQEGHVVRNFNVTEELLDRPVR